jgi:hypothetical protein
MIYRTIITSLLLLAGFANAATYDVTATFERRNENWSYEAVITNDSDSLTVTAFTLSIANNDNAHFDTVVSNTAFTVTPDIGSNNDGLRSNSLRYDLVTPLASGESRQTRGDIDINGATNVPNAVSVVVEFSDGQSRTLDLADETGGAIRWRARLTEGQAPPGPIINGQASATLTWTRPTERIDDEPIGDALAGFVLHWGRESMLGLCPTVNIKLPGCYENDLDVPNGTTVAQELTFSLDDDATMYFAIRAYTNDTDTDGNPIQQFSDYSGEVSRAYQLVITEPTTEPPLPPSGINLTVTITCAVVDSEATCEFVEITP